MTAFLCAKRGYGTVTVLGAPLEITESFRKGAAGGPTAIRELSQSLESYSPPLDRDLAEIRLGDMGDLPLSDLAMESALSSIGSYVTHAAKHGFVIMLGGEHTVTLGAVRALRDVMADLVVIQVDAHLDLLDDYLGLRVSHATVMRRIMEIIPCDSVLQVGIRSGTREEFQLAGGNLMCTSALELSDSARGTIGARPVYLTIDIDVLDPAFAPGTGYPEPGGFSYGELAAFISSLADLRVVGADVCEVSPAYDPAGVTAVAAAKLVREIALRFG